jgi:catechol 2,3-dioxygenase
MATSELFAADPIGVNVDPARIVAARDTGMTPDEIHARAMRGEFTAATSLDLRLPTR